MTSIQKLYIETTKELCNHITPFWNSLKDERGGFYGFMDFDLKLDKEAEKGVILNSRILWFYSNLYLTTGDQEAVQYAKHAYDFLVNNCIDKEYGGVYWMMNADGTPSDEMKHSYNLAFAIYGLSSYYDVTGDKNALKIAYQLFDLIETKCVDEFGYLEAFDRKWNLIDNEKLSEDGYSASKTMNTLLHIIEAYTELYRVDKNEKVSAQLIKALGICRDKVYNSDKKVLDVFFDKKMDTISDLYSYGHDIEAAWLLDRACEVLKNQDLISEFSKITTTIANNSLANALDNGALNNQFCRGEVDKTRVWWVQCEGIIGCLNEFKKVGDQRYLDIAIMLWQYSKKYLIDKREGSEWYWNVDEKGNPIVGEPIVEPWKCPYHNGRMCMEVIKRYAEFQ